MKKWHEECPNSQLKIIENAHHVSNQDNPEGTNRILLDFLESICGVIVTGKGVRHYRNEGSNKRLKGYVASNLFINRVDSGN